MVDDWGCIQPKTLNSLCHKHDQRQPALRDAAFAYKAGRSSVVDVQQMTPPKPFARAH
jgi:hypothetical protein